MRIALAAQANNGKDVTCSYLVEKLREITSIVWKRVAFADAVKNIFQEAFSVDRDFIEKWKRIPEPPPGMLINVRKGLQFIGDGFRQIKKDVWIDLALKESHIVISDSRYINEAEKVKSLGGANVLIWRPGHENNDPNPSESQIKTIVDWCLETEQDGQIIFGEDDDSIAGVENYHYFLRNDGTLEDLKNKIDLELIPWLKQKQVI